MDTINTYSPSDLIYLFIDGEADPLQQELLFTSLAGSSELREEFRQAMDIRKSFEKDRKNLVPSAALASSVFSKVGFTTAAASAAVATTEAIKTSFGSRAILMLKNSLAPLLFTGASALITSLIFVNSVKPPVSKTNSLPVQSSANAVPVVVSRQEQSAEPQIREVVRTVTVVKEVPVMVTKEVAADNESAKITPVANEDNNHVILMSRSNPNMLIAGDFDSRIKQADLLQPMPMPSPADWSNSGRQFSIEARGISGLGYYPYRVIDPVPATQLSNLGFTLNYQLADNHSLGISFGKESFQMYSVSQVIDADKISRLVFSKEPNLIWGGLTYRYTLDKEYALNSIRPFSESFLGATMFGPMMKQMLGLSFNPTGLYSFAIGLEGTGLGYQTRNSFKLTGKLGLVYSMGIHF